MYVVMATDGDGLSGAGLGSMWILVSALRVWEEHFLDHRCLSECVNLVLIVPSNQMLDGLRCQRWDER